MKINDFLTEMPELLDRTDSEDFREYSRDYINGLKIVGNKVQVDTRFETGELVISRTKGDWALASGLILTKEYMEAKKRVIYLLHSNGERIDMFADIVVDGPAIYQNEVAKAEGSSVTTKDLFMGIAWAAARNGKNYVKSSEVQTIGGQKMWHKWLAMAQSLGLEVGYFIVGENDPKPLPEDENPEKWFKKVFDSSRMVPYFKLR